MRDIRDNRDLRDNQDLRDNRDLRDIQDLRDLRNLRYNEICYISKKILVNLGDLECLEFRDLPYIRENFS